MLEIAGMLYLIFFIATLAPSDSLRWVSVLPRSMKSSFDAEATLGGRLLGTYSECDAAWKTIQTFQEG